MKKTATSSKSPALSPSQPKNGSAYKARPSSKPSFALGLRTILFVPRRLLRLILRPAIYIALTALIIIIFFAIFNPSYSRPPAYIIPSDEHFFIAANIIDDSMIRGSWGEALEGLIRLLGPQKCFVSVYGGPTDAMAHLDARLEKLGVPRRIVSEAHEPINRTTLTHVTIPSGESRIKRIAYLAAVRNKALEPLSSATITFDKVLFVNDVIFKPEDATRLLFATNLLPQVAPGISFDPKAGKTVLKPTYVAACGLDFSSPLKFYDTFATRDAEGYGMGLPLFPYFANVGKARSRKDLVEGRDSVHVRSCWGGMVAFNARVFQGSHPMIGEGMIGSSHGPNESMASLNTEPPALGASLRFRSEPEPYWDASECCLIHADIQRQGGVRSSQETDVGIFINPYVRLAYDQGTYNWLWFIRRVERLFPLIQQGVSWWKEYPIFNPLQAEDRGGDGYCKARRLLVLKEGPAGEDGLNWEDVEVPPE